MKKINLTLTIEVSADYYPARQPPYCRNPDDPRFSDCGETEQVDNIHIEVDGKEVDDINDYIEQLLYDKGWYV